MEIYQTILGQLAHYLTGLDWAFIVTFILLAYAVNLPQATAFFYKLFRIRWKTRYRTLLVGLTYGIALFFLRGGGLGQVEPLFQSLLFAMIFHKLMIDQVVQLFSRGLEPLSENKKTEKP